jgi:hypothetical protein
VAILESDPSLFSYGLVKKQFVLEPSSGELNKVSTAKLLHHLGVGSSFAGKGALER